MSVVGNLLVVATIARHRGMRTRTNLLLANLAAADILVGALDMPFSLMALVKGAWVFGTAFCKFNAFTTGLALMASIHTLMFIRLVEKECYTFRETQLLHKSPATGVIL